MLFLDLDRFKEVNDMLGHAAGDALLSAVAERLRAALRPQDTAARLGGDEFAILVENILSVTDIEHVATRVLHAIEREFKVAGRAVCVGGVDRRGDGRAGPSLPELLFRDADLPCTAPNRPAADG